jgi:hypothetical protein
MGEAKVRRTRHRASRGRPTLDGDMARPDKEAAVSEMGEAKVRRTRHRASRGRPTLDGDMARPDKEAAVNSGWTRRPR